MHKNTSRDVHLQASRPLSIPAATQLNDLLQNVGSRRCVRRTSEAKLGKLSFEEQTKQDKKAFTDRLVKPFRSQKAFCRENYLLLLKDFLLK